MVTNKIVVYTCVIGDYDSILDIKYKNPLIDYICFTTNKNVKSSFWSIRYIDNPNNLDNVRLARYYKTHPHEFLKEYEISIWIDGNVKIKSDLNNFISSLDFKNYNIFIGKHPTRDCIYDECDECKLVKKDFNDVINDVFKKLNEEGFPKKYGLEQSCIIVRKHNDSSCIKLMESWWNEILNYSKRDQLSFNYCLWKLNYKEFYELPSSLFDNDDFYRYPAHGNVNNFKLAVQCHIYDKNIWLKNIEPKLNRIKNDFDLYVSITNNEDRKDLIQHLYKVFPDIHIDLIPNLGEDVRGFITSLEYMFKHDREYDYILKIHTKHEDAWRESMLNTLIPEDYSTLLNVFKNDVNFIGNRERYKTYVRPIKTNTKYLNELRKMTECNAYTTNHFSGTMFWIKYAVAKKYFSNLNSEYFNEPYAIGDTKQHSFELLIGCINKDTGNNFELIGKDKKEVKHISGYYGNTHTPKVIKIANPVPVHVIHNPGVKKVNIAAPANFIAARISTKKR